MNSKTPPVDTFPSTPLLKTGVLATPTRKQRWGRAWLFPGMALQLLLSGCQLVEMARFSYANAKATHQWANDLRNTTVPFTLVDDHIIVPVRVNGSEPLNFVLDSGAGATVIIESRDSRALKLEMQGELPVSGVGTGPDQTAYIVPDTMLSVGDMSLQHLSVIYLPLEAIPFFDDLDHVYFDGVIGAQFFARFTVYIDYDRQEVTFSEPSAAAEHLAKLGTSWREVPLQIESGLPYMTAQVGPQPGKSAEVKLLVDTGFRGAVSLTPATHQDLSEPLEYFESVDQGLSGDVISRVAMADSLTLSGYRLHDLPIRYAMAGGESDNGSNGILGNAVLQQFNVVFDYANKRLFLTTNRQFETAVSADRSGLQIRPHVAGGIVKRIAPGSAGQASALQVGDIITTFDDRPVSYQTISDLKRTLGSGRASVRLCWLSGEEQRCEDLALASRFSEH